MLPDTLRARVIEQSIADSASLELCDIEFHLPEPSYTLSTVQALAARGEFGSHVPTLILGAETFASIERWWRVAELLQLVDLIVHTRPGSAVGQGVISSIAGKFGFSYTNSIGEQRSPQEAYDTPTAAHPSNLAPSAPVQKPLLRSEQAADIYPKGDAGHYPCMLDTFSHPSGRQLFTVSVTPFDISSSDIRAKLARKESVHGLVADAALSTLMEEPNVHEAQSRSRPTTGRRKRR